MKYIIKGLEPKELTDWKSKDKMYLRGRPSWNRVPTPIKNIVRESLRKEQGFICCYCERKLEENDFHTEHMKPETKFPKNQLDYDNLLCSCQFELEKGEPRHCGNSKGSWYDENSFISPLNPDCESKFKYTYDGYIETMTNADIAASTTIQKLQLKSDKLNALRNNAIEPFMDASLSQDDVDNFAKGYLVKKDGRFNEFYTTIKYLFTQ